MSEEKSAQGPALSVVPTPDEPAAAKKSRPCRAVLLGLALTVEGRTLPFELAFCDSDYGKDSECFLVKTGARYAVCRHCKSRHKVLNLFEALERRDISLGGEDGAWPVIMPELFIGTMFREIQSRARNAGQEPAQLPRKGAGGA